jgi:uncharacterized membrane protein
MLIVGYLAFILFIVSSYFAMLGLWLVFPFAGMEVVLLITCIYLRLRANLTIEVLTIDEDTVLIERGRHHPEKSWKYQRFFTKVFVKNPVVKGHPKKIFIRSHGKDLEVGSFLNNSDKEILIKDLQTTVYT